MTLDRVEAMLLETIVDEARASLSSAASMLGLTRPQLAYCLNRLHESGQGKSDRPAALSSGPSVERIR